MNSQEFIEIIQRDVRLIRSEYDLNQEKMAHALGMSKKTLVEIEKGRISIGWTAAVACATIFADSSILQKEFGGSATDFIPELAFKEKHVFPKTLGGLLWWRTVFSENGYEIQQNIISMHYRLINRFKERIVSSFSLKEVEEAYAEIKKGI